MVIVITSGYFDPLHEGHIECFELAKQLGDRLIVIVNSDKQAVLKKGKSFLNEKTRLRIVAALKPVYSVMLSIDEDKTVCKTIEWIVQNNPNNTFIFAKGGDVRDENFPEAKTCKRLGIEIVVGLGNKVNSSSWILGGVQK
jgi:cytidyltransferase-like protein